MKTKNAAGSHLLMTIYLSVGVSNILWALRRRYEKEEAEQQRAAGICAAGFNSGERPELEVEVMDFYPWSRRAGHTNPV